MGKLKSLVIAAASVVCAVLIGTGSTAGEYLRNAAYLSAGISAKDIPPNSSEDTEDTSGGTSHSDTSSVSDISDSNAAETSDDPSDVSDISGEHQGTSGEESSEVTSNVGSRPQQLGRVITYNRTEAEDEVDYSKFTKNSGIIERYNFGYFNDPNIITLSSGAQIRNYTEDDNAELLAASLLLPELGSFDGFELGCEEPQVLIYHTHTSESFLPYGTGYDADYPIRSDDCSRNITAVGDALCEALALQGISSVHDCTVYDHPMFTGAYYRSAETMLELLEEYPSIKIAIDIHRDGILNGDGSVTAPIAEIGDRTAAQFMIITGCDSPETDFPNYMQNFKLACLLQNCAETAYPGLARPVLFDYRNYNQSLFDGALLIEVGSQGNSLEEALYTGELLGAVVADVIETLAKQ